MLFRSENARITPSALIALKLTVVVIPNEGKHSKLPYSIVDHSHCHFIANLKCHTLELIRAGLSFGWWTLVDTATADIGLDSSDKQAKAADTGRHLS